MLRAGPANHLVRWRDAASIARKNTFWQMLRRCLEKGFWVIYFEKYIDSLTNFDSLISGNEANKSRAGQQGLLSLMDTCLTKAFDKYRLNSFKVSPEVLGIIVDCKFDRLYSQTISCFATIVESLYGAVDRIAGVSLSRSLTSRWWTLVGHR